MTRKLVQFGAGNIGRSFIGQLFARAGYEVVFVDVDSRLVDALNERRAYTVEIRDEQTETIRVEGVRAVDARDLERIAAEIASASCLGTAVGKNALRHIVPALARGLESRRETAGDKAINIIICENILDGASLLRDELRTILGPSFPLNDLLGLVETSIGKMVPIMPESERSRDPLLVYAEAYNTLICDRRGFRGEIPAVPGLDPKDNMKAFVERKSFIHNLGHAAIAYLAFLKDPGLIYTWEATRDVAIRQTAKAVMWESGRALIRAYPEEFDEASQEEHIENLLRRFGNVHLGDTIYRVGRDLPRKLGPDDRLIGAMRFDLEHAVTPALTARVAAAACFFRGRDEAGRLCPEDEIFAREAFSRGIEHILTHVCGLRPERPAERAIGDLIRFEFRKIASSSSSKE